MTNTKSKDHMVINFGNIPNELKTLPQWVCWKTVIKNGKPTKVPVDANTDDLAETDNPSTWTSFQNAKAYLENHVDVDGIGFVFSSLDPYTGIDLDDCFFDGNLKQNVAKIVESFNSYTEISPSGNGIHIIIRAEKIGDRCRKGDIEIYDKARYFTMTGNTLNGKAEIRECQTALNELYDKLFEEREETLVPPKPRPTNLSDKELIFKAMTAKNGTKFRRLWNGHISDYESHSEADLALCGLLAFWTGGDCNLIDRLFRKSGLYRKKWDREDYRTRTINEALNGVFGRKSKKS